MADEIAIDRAIRGELQSRPLDRVIAELARRQHGVVARRQLLEIGLSADAIDRRVACGRLHRIHRGVYAVGHARLTRSGRWMAAVLAAGRGAALSHRSAAALWGIRPTSAAKIEVTVPATAPRQASFTARRSRLPADEVTEVDGIPVTTVSRTLLDLAAVVDERVLDNAIQEADYLRLTDVNGIDVLLARHPRRRGCAALRRLRAAERGLVGRTRSEMEDRFKALLLTGALSWPELNATLELGSMRIEPDAIWREQRRFESDRKRDRVLAAAGFRVIRVTWRQLEDEPDALVADLSALLGRASSRTARGRVSRT